MVRPRVRRCKQTAGAFGGFSCWGALVAAPIVHAKPTTDDRLEKKLAAAHVSLDEALKRMKRTLTSITKAQRTIKRLERRIDERDHPGEPKPKKPRKRTRAIILPDDEPAAETQS